MATTYRATINPHPGGSIPVPLFEGKPTEGLFGWLPLGAYLESWGPGEDRIDGATFRTPAGREIVIHREN